MRRGSWWFFGTSMMLVGLVAGLLLEGSRLTASAAARTLTPDEAARLSQDLRQAPASLSVGNTDLAKVAKLMRPSVVHIESRRPSSRGGTVEETGSGVIVTLPGVSGLYVVTNRHVVLGSPKLSGISIQLDDGRFLTPTQVWEDRATDVAVLKIPSVQVIPARWGDSEALEIGHLVLALGSPFGLSQSVTLGIVSAKGRRSLELGATGEMLNQDFIQTDAAINPGNSGGPLVDLQGRVVGINTAIASNGGGNEGIAFSVPSNLTRRVAEALVRFGKVPRAYLGVKLDPNFTAETAKTFNLDRLRGARVLQVYEKTPAARAALQFDDIIVDFDGIEVQDENHLINLVSLTPIGRTVRLRVLRAGKTVTVSVELADRAELDGQSSLPSSMQPKGSIQPTAHERERSHVQLHELTPALARQLGLGEQTTGLVVLDSPTDSPLRVSDILIEAGGVALCTPADWEMNAGPQVQHETLVRVLRRENGSVSERLVIWQNR